MIKNILIKENQSIHKAMQALQRSAEQCLIVTNSKNQFKGTITDGDIRRYILKGNKIDSSIKKVFNNNPKYILKKNIKYKKVAELLEKFNLPLIPVIDENRQPIKFFNRKNLAGQSKNKINNKKIDAPVVIMAGGKGTRLKPFSQVLPKPLIPINDKTLIEHIINKFNICGMNKFILTINYKSRIIQSFFAELDKNYKIKFIKEEKELGTAGGLSLINRELNKPFFVTNCDTIINEDYSKIYNFHLQEKNHITIVAAIKKYVIPFGICEVDKKGLLKKITEKPSRNYLINTGMYVVNKDVIKLIPKNKKINFTDLIAKCTKMKKKISIYPIVEDAWIDVGQWPEYKKSVELL